MTIVLVFGKERRQMSTDVGIPRVGDTVEFAPGVMTEVEKVEWILHGAPPHYQEGYITHQALITLVDSENTDQGTDYWRDIAAAAAKVESHIVTQFSPKGFLERFEQTVWWRVFLGPLTLTRNGEWIYADLKNDDTEARLKYAFRSEEEALEALRNSVAPSESGPDAIAREIKGRWP